MNVLGSPSGERNAVRKCIITFCILLVWASAGSGQAPRDVRPRAIRPFTRPSEDVALAFVRPGLVAKVHVKEGDYVKAGQPLIQLDDQAERKQLAQYKAEADDKIRIAAAEAELKQAKVDLDKMEEAYYAGAATPLEYQHAQLDVVIKELTLDLARFQKKQSRLKYEEARAQVDRMRMVSPIDGRVETIAVKKGEAAKELEKILRIVKIDPLWIDVPVALSEARTKLKEGQAAGVDFDDGQGKVLTVEGKIIRIAAVADAASRTLSVRVEAPNPSQRPAGEYVTVRFGRLDETGAKDAPARTVAAKQTTKE